MDFTVRAARDDDAEGLIALIGACFAEYPGCVLDVDRESPDLRAIATAYRDRGGKFWVADREARIIASVGVVPASDPSGAELQKLYVAADSRRLRLATRLCILVEEEAQAMGAVFVDLWSDTRFDSAHRLYEKLGYTRGADTRELHDLSDSVEFYFRKEIRI